MLLLYAYSRKVQSSVRFRWIVLSILALRIVTVPLFATVVWYVWKSIPLGRILLAQPLAQAVPFIPILRPLFTHPGGYFAFYIIGRFVFPMITLFCVAGLLAGTMVLLKKLRAANPSAIPAEAPALMFTAALITDWPGVIVFVPTWIAIELLLNLFSVVSHKRMPLILSLSFAAIITIILGPIIFSSLYTHILSF